MGESHSVKKFDNEFPHITRKEAEQVIEYTAKYISNWTQRELSRIKVSKNLPPCWPLAGGGLVVGRFKLLPEKSLWRRYNQHNEPEELFSDKKSAIFHSLLYQLGYIILADQIRRQDAEVLRLRNDVVHYNHNLETAIKAHDSFKIGVISARYDDAKLRLKIAENHLQKSFKTAKYLKVWDN